MQRQLASVVLAAAAYATCAVAQTAVATEVPAEFSGSVASSGAQFLVGIQGGAAGASSVTAQRIATNGAALGARVATGRTGEAPLVEYGGGLYLMVWPDDANGPNLDLWGMTVTTSGAASAPFAISSGAQVERRAGLASDGTRFLVLYTSEVDPIHEEDVLLGRFVSTSGAVSAPIAVSSGLASHCIDGVAFGAGKYLVAWVEDGLGDQVFARIVDASGALGAEFLVSAAAPRGETVSVGFDGANFLVAWSCDVNSSDRGVFAQRVSPTGALLGARIAVSTPTQFRRDAPFLAFDGSRWLVTWTDTLNDLDQDTRLDADEASGWNILGRYLASTGAPLGPPFSIRATSGQQMLSPVASAAGRFFVAWTEADAFPPTAFGDVYGALVDPAAPAPAPAAFCTSKPNSLGCTPLIDFRGAPSASASTPFQVRAVNLLNLKPGLLLYSATGPSVGPLLGGTRCTGAPRRIVVAGSSGGSPAGADCSGVFDLDFNARIQSGVDGALVAGQELSLQFWSRDFASSYSSSLTNGLHAVIAP